MAFSPLITDLPIILLSVFVLSRVADAKPALAILSFVGAAFVAYLAYETFRTTRLEVKPIKRAPQSLVRGVVVNAPSPHPYYWA